MNNFMISVTTKRVLSSVKLLTKQKRSTEGCSKFKGPETSSGEIGLDIRTHASPKVG